MAAFDHWVPFYIGDYLADTGHLCARQHGGYLMLLFHFMRSRKPIPDEPKILAQIARMTTEEWSKDAVAIMSFWKLTKDGWIQKRAEIEAQRAERIYKKRVEAGRNSANKRKRLKRSPSTHSLHSVNTPSSDVEGLPRTTTSTKGVVDANTPSLSESAAGSVGVADAPTSQPSTTGSAREDPEFVTVTVESGARVRIDRWGGMDEMWAPRDCPQTKLTPADALDLRRRSLEASKREAAA